MCQQLLKYWIVTHRSYIKALIKHQEKFIACLQETFAKLKLLSLLIIISNVSNARWYNGIESEWVLQSWKWKHATESHEKYYRYTEHLHTTKLHVYFRVIMISPIRTFMTSWNNTALDQSDFRSRFRVMVHFRIRVGIENWAFLWNYKFQEHVLLGQI